MPDEASLDIGDFERMRLVESQEMLGVPEALHVGCPLPQVDSCMHCCDWPEYAKGFYSR